MALSELRAAQERYLQTLATSMRPRTIRQYRYALAEFQRHLESLGPEPKSFSELRRGHVEEWLKALARRRLKSGSRAKKITHLRLFFERLADWGWKEAPGQPLFRHSDVPPEDRYLPRPLSLDTDRLLCKELTQRDATLSRAILLLRATGLRSQELLDLEVTSLRQVSRAEWTLHVPLGKLHCERVIPVEAPTANLFEEIRAQRGSPPPVAHPETGRATQFLLQRPSGRRYRYDTLRSYLRRLEGEVRLPEHVTLHRLRHTFATELLQAGMRLEALMKLLGHQTLGMTLRYAEVSAAQVRREYEGATAALRRFGDLRALAPRGARRQRTLSASPRSLLDTLDDLATRLESRRRDRTRGEQKKRLQRLVDRVRSLRSDLAAVLG